ncbi:MAG: DNA polymerase III subunit alpha [Patescibacteria group bacterium]|nr:DNA polymerase III subunit alpha [Patescibacteria group bacterium]
MSFVHLHLHTEYSLLSSLARMELVLARAREYGMPAVAITDNGATYGMFHFAMKAKSAGIKPIFGVDCYKARGSRNDQPKGPYDDIDRVVVIAKNFQGYQNIMRLITEANLSNKFPAYKARIDFELLEKYHENLLILSGSINGEIPRLILENNAEAAEKLCLRYYEVFGKDFYLELQRHAGLDDQEIVNRELLRISRKHGIPVVATNDVHYVDPDDAYAQEVLLCIQTGNAIFERNRPLSLIDYPDHYFKSADEMKALFADLPEAIDNTVRIAEECCVEIPYGKLIQPVYPYTEGLSADEYLRKFVFEKSNRVKGFPPELVRKRLEYELDVIISKGYANYFLITQDFVNWAKNAGIAVGPGRGSAAGALLSYVLRITDVNPLEQNLPFERFLNPERPSPPDIDIDFADSRRDEVLKYVSATYGSDHVAHVVTFGKMEPKMAVRDVARALGLTYAQGDRISKMIPIPKQGGKITIDEALEQSEMLRAAYASEEETRQVIDITRKIQKLPRHTSVHASAVIIAPEPLTNYIALQRDERDGRIVTQYDMYCLDLNAVSENKALGLIKFDFLGLRNLTILENALNFVKKEKGVRITISEVPLDDKKTFELIGRGETIGVFQLESAGMRRLAKDLQPSVLTDITAMVALYRPGPMDLIPMFIKGKKDPKTIRYLDPSLKPILEETYGILVYQEQVMNIAHDLAGYTMGEADNLRRAMGKKQPEYMTKEKKKFVQGCVQHGIRKQVAEEIFGFMEKFAAYGFNKPHSACYALIAYWTAYVKANYPVEFMTALLSAELQGAAGPAKEQKMAQAIDECKNMGIKVLPPDINKSQEDFSIEGDNIRFGLSAIKNVGSAAIQSILEARAENEFIGFSDFLSRVDLRKVNKKTVESLVKAGAFVAFGTRATHLKYYPQLAKDIGDRKEHTDKGQFGLFFDEQSADRRPDNFPREYEYSETEIIRFEKEVLGFLLTRNPLDRFREAIEAKVTKRIGEITEADNGQYVVIAGIINAVKVVKTKKDNSDMAFLNLYDDSGAIEITVFPKAYAKFQELLGMNKVIMMKGKVILRNDTVSVMMDNAVDLEKALG